MRKIFLGLILALNGPVLFPQIPGIQYGNYKQLGTVSDTRITEASGIARSYKASEAFWLHNDSGDGPNLFLVNVHGNTLASGSVDGATSRDWEDIASFRKNNQAYLLIGDVGDNPQNKSEYWLYLIEEPEYDPDTPGNSSYPIISKIRFRYEDGSRNCESIAVDTTSNTIVLVSKIGDATKCNAYELPLSFEQNDEVQTARIASSVNIATTTAMDISPDGHRAVVLTYQDAYEYTRYPGESWGDAFSHKPRQLAMPKRGGGEAICYGPNGKTLYLATEGTSKPLYEVPAIGDTSGLVFQVDMQDVTDLYPGGSVWVNLPGQDTLYQMSDTDQDLIHIATVPLEQGRDVSYFFSYQTGPDPGTDRKHESVKGSCGNDQGNRTQHLYIDYLTLSPVIFNACTVAPEYISFRVDLSGVDDLYDSGAVILNIVLPDTSYKMTGPDDKGVYSFTLPVLAGTEIQYFYSYQNGPDPDSSYFEESVPASCSDAQGFRSLSVTPGDLTLTAVEFSGCQETLPPGEDVTDLEAAIIRGSNDDEPWISATQGAGSPDGEDISKLIDNNTNTKYLVRAEKSWIDIYTNRHSLVTAYTITSGGDVPSRDPRSWEFQGWDFETDNWVTLHTVEDNPGWLERLQRKSWYFDNTSFYNNYRLNITAINGNPQSLMQMTELQIFGEIGEFTGLEGTETPEFSLYPNPTIGMLYIRDPSGTDFSYRVYSLSGKLISEEHNVSSHTSTLDLSRNEKGIYIVQVRSHERSLQYKVVFQ